MRLECPNCHAVFEVPEALVRKARTLRCASCGQGWEPRLPEETVEEAVVASQEVQSEGEEVAAVSEKMPQDVTEKPDPATLDHEVISPEALRVQGYGRSREKSSQKELPTGQQKRGALWVIAWCASVLVVGGAGLALWHWRDVIGHVWPGLPH